MGIGWWVGLPGSSGPEQSPSVDESDEPAGCRAGTLAFLFKFMVLPRTWLTCHAAQLPQARLVGEGGVSVCSGLWLKAHQSVYE